jgi:rod shape-determining protein MreD
VGAEVIRPRVLIVLGLALVVQPVLLAGVRIDHVCPDALLLIAVLAGVAGGPEAGALVGFFAGLATDVLFLQTPLGLSALVFAILGFAVGELQSSVIHASWWIPVITALVASAVGVVLFALIGVVVGQTQLVAPGPRGLAEIAGLVAVMNAALALPGARLMSWALAPRRAE